jgi:hypothetical protein
MQKNRYTKEQMYALIRKWENGTTSQQQFYQEHGISKSTFGYWRKKYLREFGTVGKKNKFIPVKMSDTPVSGHSADSIVLIYPNGVRLVCSPDMDLARLKPIILL